MVLQRLWLAGWEMTLCPPGIGVRVVMRKPCHPRHRAETARGRTPSKASGWRLRGCLERISPGEGRAQVEPTPDLLGAKMTGPRNRASGRPGKPWGLLSGGATH